MAKKKASKTNQPYITWQSLSDVPPEVKPASDPMSQEEERVCRQLRSAYSEAMSAKKGTKHKFGERYRGVDVWLKAARMCMELSADPELFIQSQFAQADANVLFPNTFGGDWARKNYERFIMTHRLEKTVRTPQATTGEDASPPVTISAAAGEEIVKAEVDQLQLLLTRLKLPTNLHGQDALEILRTPAYPFPDWFRIVMFPADPSVWELYAEEGVRQIKANHILFRAMENRGWPVRAVLDKAAHGVPVPPWTLQSAQYPHADRNYSPHSMANQPT